MLASGVILPLIQWFADDGTPLAFGFVYTYAAGSTTPQPTYNNADLQAGHENTNPVELDAYGKAIIYLDTLNYKFDVQDADHVSIDGYPVDNIVGLGTTDLGPLPVSGGGTGDATLTDHGVMLGQGTDPVVVTSPGTAGHVLTSNGASADPTFQSPSATFGACTLLHAGSGTSTAASATSVDSFALSGLTAKDTLLVQVCVGSTTQDTAAPRLYNQTDAVDILVSDSDVALNTAFAFTAIIRQRQTSAKAVLACGSVGNGGVGGNPFTSYTSTLSTFTNDWTGSWTLALRHNGVTSGGTFDYSWAVYKLAGQ